MVQKNNSAHYIISPYSFVPKLGRKLVSTSYIDLGQGLLECIAEIQKEIQVLKIIFFDFDGVILESAEIKTTAFRRLFEEYGEVEEIVDYHEKNAGVSRYDKFDYIYDKILKKELTSEKKDELGKRFSELV